MISAKRIEERFLGSFEKKPSGCWEWSKGKSCFGYGAFWEANLKKQVVAHRWAQKKYNGPIPKGFVVRHKCDNPPCVNPEHLQVGTQKENIHDMISKGRACRGENHPDAKLTHDKINVIRKRYKERTSRFWGATELAKEYGVCVSLVVKVAKGWIWKTPMMNPMKGKHNL